jgi:hypothetical protein
MADDNDPVANPSELGRRVLAGEIDPREAASIAGEAVRHLAQDITQGRADPMRAANSIYWWAWEGCAWDDSDPSPELRSWGAEFLQLADALELHHDDPRQRATYQSLVRAFAQAVLDGTEPPDWYSSADGPLIAPDR